MNKISIIIVCYIYFTFQLLFPAWIQSTFCTQGYSWPLFGNLVQLVAVCHSMPCHNLHHTSKVPVLVISRNMPTMQSGSHVRDFHNKSKLAGESFYGKCQDGIVCLGVPYFQFHSERFSAKLGEYGSKRAIEGLIC